MSRYRGPIVLAVIGVFVLALFVQVYDTQFAKDWPGAMVLIFAVIVATLPAAGPWALAISEREADNAE